MYYDAKEIQQTLKCSFCGDQFSETIKVINCGNSICGRCFDNDVNGSKWKCKICDKFHVKPEEGYPDNIYLVRQLKIQVHQKCLSPEDIELKESLTKLQQRIDSIRSFNFKDEIDSFSFSLESQVIDAVDSAINHLKTIENNLLKIIQSHREKLFRLLESGDYFKLSESYENEVKNAELLSAEFLEYFTDMRKRTTTNEVQKANTELRELLPRLLEIENSMKQKMEINKFVFDYNPEMLNNFDILGKLREKL